MCLRLRNITEAETLTKGQYIGAIRRDGDSVYGADCVLEWWDGNEWKEVPFVASTAPAMFCIYIGNPGPNKVGAIKAVRRWTGLGLKEAKDIVDLGEASAVPAMLGAKVMNTPSEKVAMEVVESLKDVGAIAWYNDRP